MENANAKGKRMPWGLVAVLVAVAGVGIAYEVKHYGADHVRARFDAVTASPAEGLAAQ